MYYKEITRTPTFECTLQYYENLSRASRSNTGTILRIVVRVKHPNGHDPLVLALGMGGLFFLFQIFCLLCTNLSIIYSKLPSRRSITLKSTIDVDSYISGMILLPLMCGCFLAWSSLKRVSIPTLEDLALGSVVMYGSTFSFRRILELRPDIDLARNPVESMMMILTDTTLLRALYHPQAWSWMERWLVHSIFWSTFVFAFFGKVMMVRKSIWQCNVVCARFGLMSRMQHFRFAVVLKFMAALNVAQYCMRSVIVSVGGCIIIMNNIYSPFFLLRLVNCFLLEWCYTHMTYTQTRNHITTQPPPFFFTTFFAGRLELIGPEVLRKTLMTGV